MGALALVSLSVGLAMDAFAAAVCKGLQTRHQRIRSGLIVGLYFAAFQVLMPVIGYFLGSQIGGQMQQLDHWIAFGVLGFLGVQMIRQSFEAETCEISQGDPLSIKAMVPISIATSIDALAVGVTFAFLRVDLMLSLTLIGIITFGLCFLGTLIGARVGARFNAYAERLGGAILLFIALRTLITHLLDHGFLARYAHLF